jgi:hypothetical protein
MNTRFSIRAALASVTICVPAFCQPNVVSKESRREPSLGVEQSSASERRDSGELVGTANERTEETNPNDTGERLGDEAELARAVTLYDSGQYQECADQLGRLLDPKATKPLRSPAVAENARIYLGACLLGASQRAQAEEVFREAIRQNPQIRTPDSLVFPETVVERFLRVREGMVDDIRRAEQQRMKEAENRAARNEEQRELERKQIDQLIDLATQETVVEKRRRWVAAVPLGVGQFYNDDPALGWTLLGTELALSATFATALIMDAWFNSQSDNPTYNSADLRRRQTNWRTVAGVSGWALLGVGIVGIVEAQISFTPEVSTERYRPLPPNLGWSPKTDKRSSLLAPQSPGLVLQGRF